MAGWLDEIVAEERLFLPGHSACAGCGPAINMHHLLGGITAAVPGSKIVLVIPASCWTIIAGVLPASAFGVAVHLTPFGSAAVEACGIKAALRLRGLDDTIVVVWGGDGSTSDIGFAGVSAAAERNEDILYVLNDNEAYMNTGAQKSGATPEGAWTTTTPAGAPRGGQKKELARIMAAHGIPYAATLALGSVPMLKDFRAKVARAARVDGFRFLQVLGPCPPGWRYPTASPPSWRASRSRRAPSRSGSATTGPGGSRSGRGTSCRSASSSARRAVSTTSRPARSRRSRRTSTSAGSSSPASTPADRTASGRIAAWSGPS